MIIVFTERAQNVSETYAQGVNLLQFHVATVRTAERKYLMVLHEQIHHVMPREKKDVALWTAVSALISRAYHNFSLWHHEFIKAKLSAALVVLN